MRVDEPNQLGASVPSGADNADAKRVRAWSVWSRSVRLSVAPRICDLALRVLEALAGARLTVLLALLLARVARQEARALEAAAALGVDRR